MTAVEPWWTDPFGLPEQAEGPTGPTRPLTLLLIAAVLLATLGALAARRHEEPGMRAFCAAYSKMTELPQPGPPPPRASEILDSPEMRAGIEAMEEVHHLARTSGNERIVRAFAAADVEVARPRTGEPVEVHAERSVQIFMTSFEAAVEECDAAGYPTIKGGLPAGGLPDRGSP